MGIGMNQRLKVARKDEAQMSRKTECMMPLNIDEGPEQLALEGIGSPEIDERRTGVTNNVRADATRADGTESPERPVGSTASRRSAPKSGSAPRKPRQRTAVVVSATLADLPEWTFNGDDDDALRAEINRLLAQRAHKTRETARAVDLPLGRIMACLRSEYAKRFDARKRGRGSNTPTLAAFLEAYFGDRNLSWVRKCERAWAIVRSPDWPDIERFGQTCDTAGRYGVEAIPIWAKAFAVHKAGVKPAPMKISRRGQRASRLHELWLAARTADLTEIRALAEQLKPFMPRADRDIPTLSRDEYPPPA